MEIRELEKDEEIQTAFPLMSQLRDRIQAASFLAEIRRQQKDGYRLFAAYEKRMPKVLAGIRFTHTLSRGEHLFVDDLVTDSESRGKGLGNEMLHYLATLAKEHGISKIHLDSRITAKGFYEQVGFTFHSSIPCWIEVEKLLKSPHK